MSSVFVIPVQQDLASTADPIVVAGSVAEVDEAVAVVQVDQAFLVQEHTEHTLYALDDIDYPMADNP